MPLSFRLPDSRVEELVNRLPDPWTDNPFGQIIFLSKYSRRKPDNSKETWAEVVRRCVEGSYSIQQDWCLSQRIPWSRNKAITSALEMYERMYTFKFTPPGRGLWMMGTEFVHDRVGSAALLNCAFVSTVNVIRAAEFLMEASMLGIGVGFDTKGEGTPFMVGTGTTTYQIPDSREGWVSSMALILAHYFEDQPRPEFDYSLIRPAGEPIRGFGGTAAGPQPLRELHDSLFAEFKNAGDDGFLSVRQVVDIMNLIGRCVVAGNVRRSAEIALGPPSDEFLNLKSYALDGHAHHPAAEGRSEFGWVSNNSILTTVGANQFDLIAERIAANGEPGLFWLDIARRFGRLSDPPDNRDYRAGGTNPCAEQVLESFEACNLVETYPSNHEDKDDFLRTLKFAYLYAKSVTLLPTHWPETNAIMLRNRRIGCSVTGVWQFAEDRGLPVLRDWLRDGYTEVRRWDSIYSEWLTVRESIRVTSVKPSGTVSKMVSSIFDGRQVAGITPGVHPPVARSWLQRIILDPLDPTFLALRDAGYEFESSLYSPNSVVVTIPVEGPPVRTQSEVTIWEKTHLASMLQHDWADNSVSVTVTFNKATEFNQVQSVLHAFEGQMKSLSFLPYSDHQPYRQMPMEEVSSKVIADYRARLLPVDFANVYSNGTRDAEGERYCTTDVCEL